MERWQQHEIVFRNHLGRTAGFAPGVEAPVDHECVVSLFPQHMRHTGAGGFAHSGAVEINLAVFGQVVEFLGEVVGLQAHRTLDAMSAGIVIAVAADVHQHD